MLPAPTAPSTDMPVFVTRSAEASPSLDPGSPAQASLSIAAARESLAFPNFASRRKLDLGPLMPRPKTKQLRCSTALLGMTTSASRFAFPTPKSAEAASRKRKIISSGASYRLAPKNPRRNSPLPAGRDRFFGHCRPILPEGRPVRLRPPSRSPIPYDPAAESHKAKNVGASLWITGISVTTDGTLSALPESAPPPNSPKCLNLLPSLQNLPISPA